MVEGIIGSDLAKGEVELVAGGAEEFVADSHFNVLVDGVFQAGFSLIGEGEIVLVSVQIEVLQMHYAAHTADATTNVRGKAVFQGKFKDRLGQERILVERGLITRPEGTASDFIDGVPDGGA